MIDWIIQSFYNAQNACIKLFLFVDPTMPKTLASGLGTALFVFITLKCIEIGFKLQKDAK
jgi:hypothetical protein